KSLRRVPGLMKVGVKSISLDFKNQKFWSNGLLNGLFLKRSFYVSLISDINAGKSPEIPKEIKIKIQSKTAILTYSLITIFTLAFALELWLSNTFSGPSGTTLVSMGAVNHNLVF